MNECTNKQAGVSNKSDKTHNKNKKNNAEER